MWSRFDCAEAACVCACVIFGTLLTKYPFTLASRIAYAIAYVPFTFVLLSIFKRMVDAVVYTQGPTFPSWVTATANPVLFKVLLFEIVVLLMWLHASLYAPFPDAQLEWGLSVMLGTGNNSAILCDDEAAPPQDVILHACALLGVTPPPEVPFEEADLSPMARSFYAENKRVSNRRIREELGVKLLYPDYRTGLRALLDAETR